jgi:signal transduction histidine kinase
MLPKQDQAQQLQQTLRELKEAQTQLIQTEKMSSLGQLVAGIAHEINNPVNFIHGNLTYAGEYVEELLELVNLYREHYPEPNSEIAQLAEKIDPEFLSEDLHNVLASMKVGTERIRQIVVSLLSFSRLDQADLKPVNIHEGIDSSLLILHHRLKGKSERQEIAVVKEYGDLPLVECYAGQLNQVFMNLLSNAIYALDEHAQSQPNTYTPQIKISTNVIKNDGNISSISIAIADNGSGILKEVQEKIFEPFFTTKPVGKGTGLGLSISHQIVVDKHGGSMRCESQPGENTTFYLEIPLEQTKQEIVGRS